MKNFSEKQERVLKVVQKEMQEQGVDINQHAGQIKRVTDALMMVEQCLWYRIENDEKIAKLIATYEDEVSRILAILETHKFENLVYTYRSNYTNLYTYKKEGVARWYKLSKKDFLDFLSKIENGKMQVVAKTSATSAKKSASVSKLATLIVEPKKEVSKPSKKEKKVTQMALAIEEPKKQVSKPSKKEKTKKGWVEHDLTKTLKERTFVKIKMDDDTNRFVRYLGMRATKKEGFVILVDDHGTTCEINALNIKKVYTYVK